MELVKGEKKQYRAYSRHDQFAAELVYFSDCIRRNKEPEPSGVEGLIDVHVLRALYQSADTGRPVKIRPLGRRRRPDVRQRIDRPPVRKPKLIHVESAHE